ncbi:transcriptional regulator, LacI family [Porphyromonadaceae bacterium NLAE-zl-C104]|uniref:LacI family DNA-binding transcriptional regulator n=1 Tax=Proteiniphilum saccharofermentans TaxID=1642647 RepID=UPI0008E8BCBB|nr:LacI family DNA-binding transcriptional regulator [Proteiniphilum saccharofermentans]SFS96653.1 transcriptional regulator, LacI family [Porphyromonadaceae bacterium NLAE-zl-C104]
MSSSKATIKDIARALGVSVATVSRAINGSHEIHPLTKEKVLEKAKELCYKPNIQARNLLKKRSNMIGVVVPEFVTFFFPEIIIGIQEVVNKLGYQVLICQSNESSSLESRNVKMLEESMVEGMIVSVAKNSRNIDLYQRLINERMPIVFVNRVISELNASQVVIDDRKWAFKLTEHLIKCGYKRIAHLAGNDHLSVTKARMQGYLNALAAYDIPVNENLIMYVGVQQERAKTGIDYLMSLKEKPDAIFAINDPIAVGCMLELKKRGLKVPDDIAVTGFSESPIGRIMELTSVFQPTFEIGKKAAELLLKQIKDYNAPVETVILDAKLNIRNSSLPLSKRVH